MTEISGPLAEHAISHKPKPDLFKSADEPTQHFLSKIPEKLNMLEIELSGDLGGTYTQSVARVINAAQFLTWNRVAQPELRDDLNSFTFQWADLAYKPGLSESGDAKQMPELTMSLLHSPKGEKRTPVAIALHPRADSITYEDSSKTREVTLVRGLSKEKATHELGMARRRRTDGGLLDANEALKTYEEIPPHLTITSGSATLTIKFTPKTTQYELAIAFMPGKETHTPLTFKGNRRPIPGGFEQFVTWDVPTSTFRTSDANAPRNYVQIEQWLTHIAQQLSAASAKKTSLQHKATR